MYMRRTQLLSQVAERSILFQNLEEVLHHVVRFGTVVFHLLQQRGD